MQNKIPYDTIYRYKMGSEEALEAILKHYEPLIVEAATRTITLKNGTTQRTVDEDIKAFIQSER